MSQVRHSAPPAGPAGGAGEPTLCWSAAKRQAASSPLASSSSRISRTKVPSGLSSRARAWSPAFQRYGSSSLAMSAHLSLWATPSHCPGCSPVSLFSQTIIFQRMVERQAWQRQEDYQMLCCQAELSIRVMPRSRQLTRAEHAVPVKVRCRAHSTCGSGLLASELQVGVLRPFSPGWRACGFP